MIAGQLELALFEAPVATGSSALRRDVCPDCSGQRTELVVAVGRFYCARCHAAGERTPSGLPAHRENGAACAGCGRHLEAWGGRLLCPAGCSTGGAS